MQTNTVTDHDRLKALLTEALALADAMHLPVSAIHIERALTLLSQTQQTDDSQA